MDLSSRIDPVLSIARETAREVDTTPRYPSESVEALRASGLLGLTLPEEAVSYTHLTLPTNREV